MMLCTYNVRDRVREKSRVFVGKFFRVAGKMATRYRKMLGFKKSGKAHLDSFA